METRFILESTYLTTECSPFNQLLYSLYRRRANVERIAMHMKVNMTAAAAVSLMPGERNRIPGDIRTIYILADDDDSVKRADVNLGLQSSPHFDSDPKIAARRRLVYGSLSTREDTLRRTPLA